MLVYAGPEQTMTNKKVTSVGLGEYYPDEVGAEAGPCKVAGGWVEVVGGEDDGDGNIPTHPQYPRYEDTKQ